MKRKTNQIGVWFNIAILTLILEKYEKNNSTTPLTAQGFIDLLKSYNHGKK